MRHIRDVNVVLETGTWAEAQLPEQVHSGSMQCEAEVRRGMASVPGQSRRLKSPCRGGDFSLTYIVSHGRFIKGVILKI